MCVRPIFKRNFRHKSFSWPQALQDAVEKWDDLIFQAQTNLTYSFNDQFTTETIKEDLEEDEFEEDGTPA